MNIAGNIVEFTGRTAALRPRPAPSLPPLLSLRCLTIADAGGQTLVDDVGFDVPRGGTIGIVGESGSGKSLTCRAILNLLPPGLRVASGSIRYGDHDLTRLDRRGWQALRGVDLAAVFQDPASYLNPSIPVGKQLAEALRAVSGLNSRAAHQRALALLRRVGLADAEGVFNLYPFELSGGMAQRVLIAIAISANPQLLIADEATTALDVTVQAEVLALLDELRREQGLTLILVSHDLAVVAQVCDHVIVMQGGRIVEAGTTAQVLRSPAHAYTRSLVDNHARYSIDAVGQSLPPAPDPAAAPAPRPLLEITNLRAAYGNRAVLDGIDLTVQRGEILGLIGETGCGKTTVLRAILGVVAPETGTIHFNGQDISALRGRELRRFRQSSQIQHAFQDPLRSLDPDLTVAGSIGEGLDIRGGIGAAERAERVATALAAVGLDPALSVRLPRDLSGGQRQRVIIARALAMDPAILLLDEPVSALDAVNRIHVLELMRRMADERGVAQVFISHDLGSIAGITDRVAVLHEGRIVESGPTADIIANPAHPYTRRLVQSVLRLEDGAVSRPSPAEQNPPVPPQRAAIPGEN
ncbi:ABC transporter ATP-binding protein [Novosphingobium flavum]|uniref:ABC transporter ATP-binding protein n=1 Tax=Novosphingobium flavum TaxID=1778672 RepID=A0A7X1FTF7_9SPHN|nr:ABC transporter ATP-binding protein [Novosphingobium flavum]MBC2666661.1 ABC transporter ATP-binding protein [Novosphingobium flavum]